MNDATPPSREPARRQPPSRTRGAARAGRRAPDRGAPEAPVARPGALTGGGIFRPHVRGFGFVDLDTPTTTADGTRVTSTFVPPPLTGGLLADDRVAVEFAVEDDGRATASSVRLVERMRTQVFGVVEDGDDEPLLRLDPHLGTGRWTLHGRIDDLPAGVAVAADVVGDRAADPSDEFEDPYDAEALLERVRVRHRLVGEYPPEVAAEVEALLEGRDVDDAGLPRNDLRGLTTFTIDSAESRDLDDALSVHAAEPDGGLRVLVHICDVAAHVRPGSALDAEARRVATSVYLPGWVRPMLPPELSEDALSLLPGQDRDALTVELRLAADGTVTAVDLSASRIRSDARLTYDEAAAVLAGGTPEGVSDEVVDALRWLRTAGARLGVQRLRRGGVEARRVEPDLTVRVVDGHAEQVEATPSNPAHLLIERLMVAANESVAAWLIARGLPGVFRTHPEPRAEAAPALEAFCAAAGFHPGFGARLTPLGLSALSTQLDAAADDTAAAVWDVLLSFLGRATYTPHPGPHFGLASQSYLHFTSPIRRYADLTVHRVVRAFLAGERDPGALPSTADLEELCAHIDASTGVAARAENQMRKALWLVALAKQSKGAPEGVLNGRVTGIHKKGVFVTLDGSRVSGMLPSKELPGRGWAPSDDGLALVDSAGSRLGYGEHVQVRIGTADVEAGELELMPLRRAGRSDGQRPQRPQRPSGSRSRSRGEAGDARRGNRAR
jgi:ribonuclease R